MSTTPSDFRVPVDYISPFLDGVYLAINALPGSYLVYDAHSCGYYKAEKIAGNHDLFSTLMRWGSMNRVVRTDLDSREYVLGSEDKLSMKIRQVAERGAPDVIVVARSNIVMVTGQDAQPVVHDLARRVDVPIVLLSDKSVESDHVSGYLHTLSALIDRLALEGDDSDAPTVTIAGYVYDRNEGDHRGNISELTAMIEAVGGGVGASLLDGRSFSALRTCSAPDVVVDVADGWDGARRLAARYDAQYLALGLPLGIEGTSRWIRKLSDAVGTRHAAERYIDESLSSLVPQLQWLLPRFFFGRRAIVLADRLLLPALVDFFQELGMIITAQACTSVSYASADASRSTQPDQPPKTPDEFVDFLCSARRRNDVDLVVGNSFIRQLARLASLPCLELGYPSTSHHVIAPAPFLGFSGVRFLVERVVNALQGWDGITLRS